MTRIALHGAGRMSAAIVQAAKSKPRMEICAVVAPHAPGWQDAPPYFSALDQIDQTIDVVIDFSMPDGTEAAANWCLNSDTALLSGVTNLHQEALDSLALASEQVPVLWSANLSLGVNLLAQLCAQAATVLEPDTAISIADIHHQWKKDSPSGTALMLGQAVIQKQPQQAGNISYTSIREGEVIGLHEVTFCLAGERIVLSHEAQDRMIFAQGAIAAALWLGQQAPGRYTTADWLSRFPDPED